MVKPTISLLTVSIFLMFFSFNPGGLLNSVNGQATWCIPKTSIEPQTLLAMIDYACTSLDCSSIQQGGSCFYPNTDLYHAAYAMNKYYQREGRHQEDCDFDGCGMITLTDPSSGSCKFESSGGLTGVRSSSATWCLAKPGTDDASLQDIINYACHHVNCKATLDGGPCYSPTTLINHASYAMNRYYQFTNKTNRSCDFRGMGAIVTNDPSYGNCIFVASY